MRIPPSVIVMSLVTAIPFGLGIRDTLANKGAPAYEDDVTKQDRKDREAYEAYQAEAAREIAEAAAMQQAMRARVGEVHGSAPASLGTMFAGLELTNPEVPAATLEVIGEAQRVGLFTADSDPDAGTLTLAFSDAEIDGASSVCAELKTRLERAWGPSTQSTWIDPATQQRASFVACDLTIDRSLTPAQWVAGLHVEAYGKPAGKLLDVLPAGTTVESDVIHWSGPGVGYALGGSEMWARNEHGKIAALGGEGDTDFTTATAIRDELSRVLKAKPTTDDDGAWVWTKHKVSVTYDIDTQRLELWMGPR